MTATRVVVVAPEQSRAELVRALGSGRDVIVVGSTSAPADASGLIDHASPDVAVVDLSLPGGSARRVIAEVMNHTPLPILALETARPALSGSADGISAQASEAMAAGAVEVLPRPGRDDPVGAARIRRRAEILRGVPVIRRPLRRDAIDRGGRGHPAGALTYGRRGTVVGLAASTGGPAALGTVLGGLGGLNVPVLVVQHLHPDFVAGFVTFLARASALPVKLAENQVRPEAGVAYIGPSGVHLRLGPEGRMRLDPDPAHLYRPSADELFASIAEVSGGDAIAALLTGMGDDGAAGLLAMRRAGGTTIVQDEASSAVFGMPGAAQRLGAASQILPLERIARAILRAAARVSQA